MDNSNALATITRYIYTLLHRDILKSLTLEELVRLLVLSCKNNLLDLKKKPFQQNLEDRDYFSDCTHHYIILWSGDSR